MHMIIMMTLTFINASADVDGNSLAGNDDDDGREPFCLKISQVRRRRSAHWSEIYGSNDVASCVLTPPCHQQQCPFLWSYRVIK